MNAIGIVYRDINAAIKFYQALGLEFQSVGGPDHYECQLSHGLKLMLDSEDLAKKLFPEWTAVRNQNVSLCFEQDKASDVDDMFTRLVALGGQEVKKPWNAFWGQRYATVFDPQGNQIDLYASL